MVKEVILTREGYEKLKQEIEHLSTEKRREVAERIRIAHQFDPPGSDAHNDAAAIFKQRTRAEWKAFNDEHDCCIEPVLDLMGVRPRWWGLLWTALALAYIVWAVRANSPGPTDAATSDPVAPQAP